MSEHEPGNLMELRRLAAPEELVRRVERDGVAWLQAARMQAAHQERARRRSWSVLAVNVGLTAYCLGQILMCARTVGILP